MTSDLENQLLSFYLLSLYFFIAAKIAHVV